MRSRTGILLAFPVLVTVSLSGTVVRAQEAGPPLPGTGPLTMTGDIARTLVDGVDRFLLGQIAESTAKRAGHGSRDCRLGRGPAGSGWRTSWACATRACRSPGPSSWGRSPGPTWSASGARYDVFAVRWPAFGDVTARACCSSRGDDPGRPTSSPSPTPTRRPSRSSGWSPGCRPESQVARRLAESGCRVIVPTLIDRDRRAAERPGEADQPRVPLPLGLRAGPAPDRLRGAEGAGRWSTGSRRRPARTRRPGSASSATARGALIALYAAALDPRIDAVCVSGYFEDRNARLAAADRPQRLRPARAVRRRRAGQRWSRPRPLVVEAAQGPGVRRRGRAGRRRRASSTTPKLDDGQGRGRPRPRARRRARRRPRASSWSPAAPTAPGRSAPRRPCGKLLARARPRPSSGPRRRRAAAGLRASTRRKAWSPARPASSTRSTATTSSCWSRARTSAAELHGEARHAARSRPTRRPSSRTARSSPRRSSASSTTPLLPPNVRSRQGLRRAEVHRLRGGAWTSSPT